MTNLEFATALRHVADLYENDKRMVPDRSISIYSLTGRDGFLEMVRGLKESGFPVKQIHGESDSSFVRFELNVPGSTVQFSLYGGEIMKRVERTRTVTEWELPEELQLANA